jgi:hypothetical protein
LAGNRYRYEEQIIVLDDLNFSWEKKVIDKVIELWNQGVGLRELSKIVCRKKEETFLLLLDLAMKEKIKKREGAIWGI